MHTDRFRVGLVCGALAIASVPGTAWSLAPTRQSRQAAGVTIFPARHRTVTIVKDGSVVSTHEVPGNVGIFVEADGGVVTPGAATDWLFVATGTGEIRLVPFPLPDAPGSPDRLPAAFAHAPVVLSFTKARVTITGPASHAP